MPRRLSSLSKARWYTFSRNPAPSVLETSNTAPSTFSLKEFKSVLSAFTGVHLRPICYSAEIPQKRYGPPMNADERRSFKRNPRTRSVQLILGHYTSGFSWQRTVVPYHHRF